MLTTSTGFSAFIRRSLSQRVYSSATQLAKSQALVFPGQGSQYVGMTSDLAKEFKAAYYVLQEADESLGFYLSRLMENGSQDELTLTMNAQPALLTHSIAVLQVLKEEIGFQVKDNCSYVMGHSLGEFSALTAANFFRFSDAVRIVRKRGELMQKCISPSQSAMTALMPITIENALKRAREASEATGLICDVANINSTNQVVISGNSEAVSFCASECIKHKEARRAIPLDVSAPFHSRIMQPAADGLSLLLEKGFESGLEYSPIIFQQPDVPLVSNVTAQPVSDVIDIKALMIQQTISPVNWVGCVKFCQENEITNYIELGAGRVLSNLIKTINPSASVRNIKAPEDIVSFIKDSK